MANLLLRLTVHDPVVIKALDALRKTRKQSAFVVEALKHFLITVQGKEQLASYLALERICPEKTEVRPPEVKKKTEPESPQGKQKTNLDDIFNL
jgi:hypothetical protein